MLNRYVVACAVAAMWASVGLAAGSPQAIPGSQESSRAAQAPAAQGAMVHYEGCVYREGNAQATPAQATGYILANVKDLSKPPNQVEAAAEASAGPIYKLRSASEQKLRELEGHRVAVTGRIGAGGTFDVSTLRAVQGVCSMPPAQP